MSPARIRMSRPLNVCRVLEDVLLTHPAVVDAAVVPCPDGHADEGPRAVITARRPVPAGELIAWVADQVSSLPRIREIKFVDPVPQRWRAGIA
jgi:acyl-coenzyme A synthetase/AMP-(fatty) acid ligase